MGQPDGAGRSCDRHDFYKNTTRPAVCSLSARVFLLLARNRGTDLEGKAAQHFSSDSVYRRFTTRYAGKVAGGPNNEGYHYVRVGRGLVGAHRVIWAMITGAWPDPGLQIDHIDLNKSNNRISNLTLVSPR